MKLNIPKLAKGALLGSISFAGSLVTALQDNGVTSQEWAVVAFTTLSTLGGYFGITHPVDADEG